MTFGGGRGGACVYKTTASVDGNRIFSCWSFAISIEESNESICAPLQAGIA